MASSRDSASRNPLIREAQDRPSMEYNQRSLSCVKKSWLRDGWRYLWAVYRIGKEELQDNIENLLMEGWTFCMKDEFPQMKTVREEMEKAGLRTQRENYITRNENYLMKIPEEIWKKFQEEERRRYEIQNRALYTVDKNSGLTDKTLEVSRSKYNSFGY